MKKKFKYFIFFALSLLISGFVGNSLYQEKKIAHVNLSLPQCIVYYKDNILEIDSMSNLFKIEYVKNTTPDCPNSPFPAIHITSQKKHNAWLHIIFTDHKNQKLMKFVDSANKEFFPQIYPFYTLSKDFYDAPKWNIGFFNKPISFWEGHAYAIIKDENNRILDVLGGIKWGFKIIGFFPTPKMIIPTALSMSDWNSDLIYFNKVMNLKN